MNGINGNYAPPSGISEIICDVPVWEHTKKAVMRKSKEIGLRLKEERERLGLSQAEMAEQLTIGRGTQIRYENGTRSPSAEYLASAATLGCSPNYIVLGHSSRDDDYYVPKGNFPWSGVNAYEIAAIVFRTPEATDRERALAETILTILGKD